VPIALRVIYPDRFVRGPFYLGKLSYPIAVVSTLWISFMLIVLCLPELNPVNSKTLNYTPVAFGVVLVYALGFWVISARKWYPSSTLKVRVMCDSIVVGKDLMTSGRSVCQCKTYWHQGNQTL